MSKKWKIAGINFDHQHMGDLLRQVFDHPGAEIAGISDEQPARMEGAIKTFGLPRDRVFTDYRACLEKTKPDLVILCPATLMFNGDTLFGREDRTTVIGGKGAIRSSGPDLLNQHVTLYTSEGVAHPKLQGRWLPDGMRGTMGELLCAIEENREPSNSARNNLLSLEFCFAASAGADSGQPQIPGAVRRLPDSCITRSLPAEPASAT